MMPSLDGEDDPGATVQFAAHGDAVFQEDVIAAAIRGAVRLGLSGHAVSSREVREHTARTVVMLRNATADLNDANER